MQPPSSLIAAFAPTGKLRASINLGNAVLAHRHPQGGAPFGISVDLAHELARRLGLELELVVCDGAAKSVQAVTEERADVGFFAIDPLRAAGVSFTPPYVVIEGSYLVRQDAPIRSNQEVDQAGTRVAVAGGSAYDLYLSRTLQQAQIVRAATSQEVVDTFIAQGLEVAAGVRQQLEADVARLGGLRILDGRFMVINQAMGLPKGRAAAAFDYLVAFVEEMKASGMVAAALARHGIQGAGVAAPGYPAD